MPPRLLSPLIYCVHFNLHTGPRAPILCSARALRARCQFGRSKKSMTSVMSVAMSGVGGSAATIAFVTWYRRFGSTINRLRSAVFGVSSVLSLFLQFGPDLCGMQTFAYTSLLIDSGDSKGGRQTLPQPISRRPARFVRIKSKRACHLLRLALWNV